jgi:hypothetical protein
MLNSHHNRGNHMPSFQRFMRVWFLQRSLRQRVPRIRRLFQHQVHTLFSPNHLP